jgi:hypothetical protein
MKLFPILKVTLLAGTLVLATAMSTVEDPGMKKYKCMIQLTNYTGEGAYIVVSVLDSENNYVKTLRVLGDDEEWYQDMPSWWKWHLKNDKPNIDGITGATISGGERSIFVVDIDEAYIDAGYQLRFETAVEHQKYVEADLQMPLTTEALSGKAEGTEYIRYVRMIPNN